MSHKRIINEILYYALALYDYNLFKRRKEREIKNNKRKKRRKKLYAME